MSLIIRLMKNKDYEPFRRLFDEACAEYLEFLKQDKPQQYWKEKQETSQASRERFNFYLRTKSCFVAEENDAVIGYVTSQTIFHMHGVDKLLWIEYIVVRSDYRLKGIGAALLKKLMDYARRNNIDRIYTTINPDNKASIRLHAKAGFSIKNWKIASLKN